MRIARITSLALLTFSAAALAQAKPPTPETLGGPDVMPGTLIDLSACASTTPSVVKSEKPVCSILPAPKPTLAPAASYNSSYGALLKFGSCAASHGRFC
jgi:hypothetical protein